ncbi:MAG: hypothetical protein JJV98_11100 [Desulfosarcina sp.]|nr:hypothetical protein [Desulfobacterales bacterium]
MQRNPVICLLLVSLMIVGLTGQAAAALRMACQGTASCCCRNVSRMYTMPADMAPMDPDCCDPTSPQPCDLAGPRSAPMAAFLPVENNAVPDSVLTLARAASAAVDAIKGGPSGRISIRPPSPAGPPVYLLIQSFLC